MPSWNSPGERRCRTRAEALKNRLSRGARSVTHPCLRIRRENLEVARKNLRRHDWAKRCYDGMLAFGDYYASRSAAWVEAMVPALSALHVYGAFCPACGGDNTYDSTWDYRDPDRLTCVHCKAVMTDQRFPEQGRLTLPRTGQTFTYYLRPEERVDPLFSTGRNAYTWAGRRIHISPASFIRHRKTGHMTGVARTLAILYRMTGEDRYAHAAGAILKRFAEVYPHYVLRDYWNTAMDCDPLYACELVVGGRNVAKYEVNACPDQPGRSTVRSGKLIHPLWGGGRMACGGLNAEALLLVNLTEALDLLWDATDRHGAPFLSAGEREVVVRDLIAEGLLTFTCWEGVNNKVAGCRVGEVALGRFLGAPDFVHRGVSAFGPVLADYFKFDGTSPEGASYHAYTMSNLWQLPEYALGYTDPPGYRKRDRYEDLDLYAPDGPYGTVLRARVLMTLPDGRVPHTADALEGYPGPPRPEWLHTMSAVRMGKAFASFSRTKDGDAFALFNRPPSARGADPPPVRDLFFPGWLQAIFHTGYDRMFQEDLAGTATFLMSLYRPETHNHEDALNIAMFAEGVEVLSDLGYVGDHPINSSLRSTAKHNLVVVNEKNQLGRGARPAGNVRLIAGSPRVKVLDADCRAYEESEVYRRCCAMVHRGAGLAYVVDTFRVKGGEVHDYALHGEGRISALPAFADGSAVALSRRRGIVHGDVERLRVGRPADGASPSPWSVAWTERPYGGESNETASRSIHGPLKPGPGDGVPRMSEQMTMRAHFLSPVSEVIIGEGPGQRNHGEIGARHDYLFGRNRERGRGNTFVTLIEHYREAPDILSVRAAVLPDGASGPAAVEVIRRSGQDLVILDIDDGMKRVGEVSFAGRVAVHSREADGRIALFLAGGSAFHSPEISVTLPHPVLEGAILSFDASGFEADRALPAGAALAGSYVEVEDPKQGCWTAYAIRSVRGRRVVADLFPFNGGTRYRVHTVFSLDQEGPDRFLIRSTSRAQVRLPAGRFTQATLGADVLETQVSDGWLELEAGTPGVGVLHLR